MGAAGYRTCPLGVVGLACEVVQVEVLAGVEEVQLVVDDQGVVRGTRFRLGGELSETRPLPVPVLDGLDGTTRVLEEDEGTAVGREAGADLAVEVYRGWLYSVKLTLLPSFFIFIPIFFIV